MPISIWSPSLVSRRTARTDVARFPSRSPDPWVPVAIPPATEMCGQRGHVRQGQALGLERDGQLRVGDRGSHGDAHRLPVDLNRLSPLELIEPDKHVAVRHRVERVTGIEDPEGGRVCDQPPQLRHGPGTKQRGSAVPLVPGPIRERTHRSTTISRGDSTRRCGAGRWQAGANVAWHGRPLLGADSFFAGYERPLHGDRGARLHRRLDREAPPGRGRRGCHLRPRSERPPAPPRPRRAPAGCARPRSRRYHGARSA